MLWNSKGYLILAPDVESTENNDAPYIVMLMYSDLQGNHRYKNKNYLHVISSLFRKKILDRSLVDLFGSVNVL